jgi:hypothetical protein
MKKIIGIIKSVIAWTLGIAFFSFAIAMAMLLLNYNDYGVTQMGNTSLILINGEISSEKYKKGDLVLVEATKLDKINTGDEIFVYQVDKDGVVTIDLGTIDKVHTIEKAITFKNGDTYAAKFLIGKPDKVYNKVGTYLSIIESKWGFLFIILVPSFLIFMYELSALITEIKYGKDEA